MYLEWSLDSIDATLPMYTIPVIYNILFQVSDKIHIDFSVTPYNIISLQVKARKNEKFELKNIDELLDSDLRNVIRIALIQSGVILPRNIQDLIKKFLEYVKEKEGSPRYILLDKSALNYRVISTIMRSSFILKKYRDIAQIQLYSDSILRYWIKEDLKNAKQQKREKKRENVSRLEEFFSNIWGLGISEYDFHSTITKQINSIPPVESLDVKVPYSPEKLFEHYKHLIEKLRGEPILLTADEDTRENTKMYGIYTAFLEYPPDLNTVDMQFHPYFLSSLIFVLTTIFEEVTIYGTQEEPMFVLRKATKPTEYPSVFLEAPQLKKGDSEEINSLIAKMIVLEKIKEIKDDFTVL